MTSRILFCIFCLAVNQLVRSVPEEAALQSKNRVDVEKLLTDVYILKQKMQQLEAWKEQHILEQEERLGNLDAKYNKQGEELKAVTESQKTVVSQMRMQSNQLNFFSTSLTSLTNKDNILENELDNLSEDLSTHLTETTNKQDNKIKQLSEVQKTQSSQINNLTNEDKSTNNELIKQSVKLGNISKHLESLASQQSTQGDELSDFSKSVETLNNNHHILERELGNLSANQNNLGESLEEISNNQDKKLNNLANIQKTQVSQINNLTSQQSIRVMQLKNLETTQLEALKIVKSPEGTRSQACGFTCVGSTGRSDTEWKLGSNGGIVYTNVDISKCGFANTPVITVSVEGDEYHMYIAGTSSVYYATSTEFVVHLRGWVQTSSHTFPDIHYPSTTTAKDRHWNVMWSAFGFKLGC